VRPLGYEPADRCLRAPVGLKYAGKPASGVQAEPTCCTRTYAFRPVWFPNPFPKSSDYVVVLSYALPTQCRRIYSMPPLPSVSLVVNSASTNSSVGRLGQR